MKKKLPVKTLTKEAFNPYGSYADMVRLSVKEGAAPQKISFTPDMTVLQLNQNANTGFSVTTVQPRENTIDFMEYHAYTGEGILPLDGDVYVHLAPPSMKGEPPLDTVEVFRVPQGTMLSIRMGVWHGAPYAAGEHAVHVLCVLPERTYANDCKMQFLAEDQQIDIDIQ